jgi:hypothetical protein
MYLTLRVCKTKLFLLRGYVAYLLLSERDFASGNYFYEN